MVDAKPKPPLSQLPCFYCFGGYTRLHEARCSKGVKCGPPSFLKHHLSVFKQWSDFWTYVSKELPGPLLPFFK